MRFFNVISLLALMGALQNSAYAATYKCFAKDMDTQEKPYEVEVSFDPVGVKFTMFFKDNDTGKWSPHTEVLADASSVLKPIPIKWSTCEVSKVLNENEYSLNWTYKSSGEGHLNLNLQQHTGEFYSCYEFAGHLCRIVKFYDCKLI